MLNKNLKLMEAEEKLLQRPTCKGSGTRIWFWQFSVKWLEYQGTVRDGVGEKNSLSRREKAA